MIKKAKFFSFHFSGLESADDVARGSMSMSCRGGEVTSTIEEVASGLTLNPLGSTNPELRDDCKLFTSGMLGGEGVHVWMGNYHPVPNCRSLALSTV